MHVQRCMDCDEIAVIRGVYCKTHGRCKICKHKPRLEGESTCGRHPQATAKEPWAYPSVPEKKRTFTFAMILAVIREMFAWTMPPEILTEIEEFSGLIPNGDHYAA